MLIIAVSGFLGVNFVPIILILYVTRYNVFSSNLLAYLITLGSKICF